MTFHSWTASDFGLLAVVIVLLSISAMVSSSETAFFSLTPKDIHNFREQASHSRGARSVLKLLSMQDYLLATILVTNNLVNIAIVLVSNVIIDSWITFSSTGWEFAVKTIIVTFLLLLFGEIMPKIFATTRPSGVAKMMAGPLLVLKKLFKPFSYLLISSGNQINESVAHKKVNISMDELSNAIEMTSDQTEEEKQMLSGIVSFVNTEVVEIMKPRVDIVALGIDESFSRVKEVIISSGFSRIPVYEESIDNIKGILYVKDLLSFIGHDDRFEWKNLIRKPYFVPEYKKINDLLAEFQQSQVHVAIIVDEYGSTLGLVTLEDILEEIVGEIADESDVEQDFYTKVDDNTYIFDGKTHLNEVLKVLRLDDEYLEDVQGEAESIAGLMLEINKDFLKPGDTVICKNLLLKAESITARRIEKVRVEVMDVTSEDVISDGK